MKYSLKDAFFRDIGGNGLKSLKTMYSCNMANIVALCCGMKARHERV